MNPVFIFLVIASAAILWVLLAGLYRIIGAITLHFAHKAKDAIDDKPTSAEAFIRGFRDALNNSESIDIEEIERYTK